MSKFKKKYFRVRLKIASLLKKTVVKSAYGIKLAMNDRDKTFRLYYCGSYGSVYWDHLSQYNTNFVFLDIGANQGLYTICSAINDKCIKSYAFEPVPMTFEFLKRNVDLNQVTEKCVLLNKAISGEHGQHQIVT